MLIPKLFLP